MTADGGGGSAVMVENRDNEGVDRAYRDGLRRGGRSGKLFVPGKASKSLIVKRLKGLGGVRMPKGGTPLADDEIRIVSRWIDQGARL